MIQIRSTKIPGEKKEYYYTTQPGRLVKATHYTTPAKTDYTEEEKIIVDEYIKITKEDALNLRKKYLFSLPIPQMEMLKKMRVAIARYRYKNGI